MQNLLKEGPLLDDKGNLAEAGYAFSLVKEYNRKAIKGLKSRIKEWDYYYIGNKDYGVAFTISDSSYLYMASISFLDFNKKFDETYTPIGLFSFGKLNIPSSSKNGDLFFKNKNCELKFLNNNGKRHLIINVKKFGKTKKPFLADIELAETNKDSMVIATPFNKKKHFYYNQKINLLKATGFVNYNDNKYDFNDSYGVLDWGRGIWTYKNSWYWSSANSTYEGKRIGWNLGYGFGDTSRASENMFFYNDQAYKLNDVIFKIPQKNGKDDFMSPWTLSSLSGDINVIFKPIYNRSADTNMLIIRSNQHQIFGLFTGNIKIKGEEVYFENVPGFAEKVYNRW